MRSPGFMDRDISNRIGASFQKPFNTPGRNYKDDVSHTTFGELENILEKERAKFKEHKQKMESDLDNERKLRIQFQNKLIRLKDQFSRKDVQLSQFEFRQNNILHQIQDYQIENERLKTEFQRLQELYRGRVFELENELVTERKQNEQTLQEYKTQFEKFKKEGGEYVQTLNFEHDRKVKSLEEKCKVSENFKRELTMENKKLNDIAMQNKIAFEEELRDITNRLRQDELRKSQFMAKSFEQRIKSVEEAKEAQVRRVQDLTRQLQDRERQIQQIQNQKNDELERVRLDNSDLNTKYAQMNFLYQKAKGQIAQKEATMSRNTGQSTHEVTYLKEQVNGKRKEIDQLNQTIKELRQGLKDQASDLERKRAEIVDKCAYFEAQSRRYKEQNTKIYDTLKAKINETISHVGTTRR